MSGDSVEIPREAWDEFVTELLSHGGWPGASVSSRTAARLAAAGDPSLVPPHSCRPGVVGSAYGCPACWIGPKPTVDNAAAIADAAGSVGQPEGGPQ